MSARPASPLFVVYTACACSRVGRGGAKKKEGKTRIRWLSSRWYPNALLLSAAALLDVCRVVGLDLLERL